MHGDPKNMAILLKEIDKLLKLINKQHLFKQFL